MIKGNTRSTITSSPTLEVLEEFTRIQVQRFIQGLLEEEVTELLGRRMNQSDNRSWMHKRDIVTVTVKRES